MLFLLILQYDCFPPCLSSSFSCPFYSDVYFHFLRFCAGSLNYKYMEKVMPHLMPTLLATLERQNEDADDEDWNLASAASVCIQNIAQCCEDKVTMVVGWSSWWRCSAF